MSWSRVQGGGVGSDGSFATITASLTGVGVGNVICVGICTGGGGTPAVSDGHNTYTSRVTNTQSTNILQIWTAPVTTGGALSLVLTGNGGTAEICSLVWAEYAYTPGATLSLTGTPNSSGNSGTSAISGNITVTTPCLGYSVCKVNVSSASAANGFTARTSVPTVAGKTTGLFDADNQNAASSPLEATFAWTGSNTWQCAAIAFLATGGTGPALRTPPIVRDTTRSRIAYWAQ